MSRFVTFIVVLAFHLAVLAALLTATRMTRGASSAPPQAVQIVYVSPVTLPKVRSASAAPRRPITGLAIEVSLPVLAKAALGTTPPPATGSDGNGAGVDWAAEARRALRAFEIRSHQPARNNSVTGGPGAAWLRQVHHGGDRTKTANGDWIRATNRSRSSRRSIVAAGVRSDTRAARGRDLCAAGPRSRRPRRTRPIELA